MHTIAGIPANARFTGTVAHFSILAKREGSGKEESK